MPCISSGPQDTSLVVKVLERRIARSEAKVPGHRYRLFDWVGYPASNLLRYILNIQKHFICSPECVWIAMAYMDRLLASHPDLSLSRVNVHKIVLACMVVAIKFQDDEYDSNLHFARVVGIPLAQVNASEGLLVKLLNWRMYVSETDFRTVQDSALHMVGKPSRAWSITPSPYKRVPTQSQPQAYLLASGERTTIQMAELSRNKNISQDELSRMRISKFGGVHKDPTSRPRTRRGVPETSVKCIKYVTEKARRSEQVSMLSKHAQRVDQDLLNDHIARAIKHDRAMRGRLQSTVVWRMCRDDVNYVQTARAA